jgi:hypothetical protein
MKKNSLGTLLVVILAGMVVATAGLSLAYVRYVQKMQKLEIQANTISQNINLVQALASESVEYSHRNPAMRKVLDSVGIKINSNTNQAGPKNGK